MLRLNDGIYPVSGKAKDCLYDLKRKRLWQIGKDTAALIRRCITEPDARFSPAEQAAINKLKDADILIYNSTIDGPLSTLDELLEKAPLLADCKAVKTGEVWCTEQSMFQKTSAAAGMISDFHAVLSGQAEGKEKLTFLHKLT